MKNEPNVSIFLKSGDFEVKKKGHQKKKKNLKGLKYYQKRKHKQIFTKTKQETSIHTNN